MRIIPEKVPWMISPSHNIQQFKGNTSYLSVSLFCQKDKSYISRTISQLKLVYDGNIPEEILNSIGYINIEIKFEPVYYFAVCCPQYPKSILDPEIYDTTLLTQYYDDTNDFNDSWSMSGICPDSGFYCVSESTYFQQFGISNSNNKIKHWILTGHDEELHVLAERFIWKEI